MLHACGMQPQEILVLREQHASLGPCPLHVFLVHGAQETSFRYGNHVNAAVPQATDTARATCSSA